jgi:ribulose-phosphate 3-epimerase
MFIDFGNQFTSVSIWTNRGPIWHTKIQLGGQDITNAISEKFGLNISDADRIKSAVASMIPTQMDRFTPADTAYDFSRSDINEVVLLILAKIIEQIKDSCLPYFTKYKPAKIILTGGGAEIDGLRDFIENAFAVTTDLIPIDASVRALSDFIWAKEQQHRNNYINRQEKWERRINKIRNLFHKKPKKQPQFVPILPSTLCFDMSQPETYTLFKSGGISMIHVDIMDGFYVDKISGSIEELRKIRERTNAHLHVHLMTESPNIWAADAIAAGADTIILSTNTSGLRAAIRTVHAAGKRVGIALNPESSVTLLKSVLRDIDEVMIMSVHPGAAGQSFEPSCLHKISVLAGTRKKYGLKFIISVDGGINDKNAQLCWDAGANLLVSGSYLANASDFPLAVQSLLKQQ